MCIVMVSTCPSVSLTSLSLSLCCQSNQNWQQTFHSVFSSPLPNSRFILRLPMPCFPYFGMSMCYLLTLCMNDNLSVYSYRESYPIPLVLTKNGLNVVQILVFCSSFILFSYIFLMYVELKNNMFLI